MSEKEKKAGSGGKEKTIEKPRFPGPISVNEGFEIKIKNTEVNKRK